MYIKNIVQPTSGQNLYCSILHNDDFKTFLKDLPTQKPHSQVWKYFDAVV